MKILIAGIGQPWQRDLAFGSHVVKYLQGEFAEAGIDVLDLSFGPIAALQLIREGQYQKIVFVTSRDGGRARGVVHQTAPELGRPSDQEIHARIGDSVMGCVSLENLLILCQFHNVLPPETTILEVEPEDDTWGPELSDGVAPLVALAARFAVSLTRESPGTDL